MNYVNTLITIAEDCPHKIAVIPQKRAGKITLAFWQYELLKEDPYRYNQDELLFLSTGQLNGGELLIKENYLRFEEYVVKDHPCLRSSQLAKLYGWGFHFNEEGRIKLLASEGEEYQRLLKDEKVKKLKALRSKRK